ncbi:uncharacterized protein [Epargyreus clarus]|uniref:uncharacterized protein n=1 Tax=Epargyreus clarus TaxID=520877 RepID=UPI003C2B2C17
MRKQDSYTSYELTSSDSEIGKLDGRKRLGRRRYFMEKFQKELTKEYLKYEKELYKNRVQQYPSKRDYSIPNPVFSTPHCQVMNVGSHVQTTSPGTIIPTNYSAFWEYMYDKVCGKSTEKEVRPCFCPKPPVSPQHQSVNIPENFEQFAPQPEQMPFNEQIPCIPECKSCLQQTEDAIPGSLPKIPQSDLVSQPSKKTKKQNVKCECHLNKKRKKQSESLQNPQMSMTQGNDVTRPCQNPHDDITRTVEEKYNGEILCIHNPPCVLINGCLNLPNSNNKTPIQGNVWPVTQDKKTSLYHMCRKIRRPKPKRCEQACQYHPPSIDVQTLQIKTEKIVQSICNHNPPCEVVHGCYKAKYDPKLENSCIHVPMCERLPECRMAEKRERESGSGQQCEHKPKCTEVPLCSRKFVVLTARGTVGTQVRPKSKLVCRHEPPCIMIPKCLARIISDGYIPYEAIPDCVHQPCCEMIPACCRKAAKDMPDLTSFEEGISLKLPRAPMSHKNKLLRVMRRSKQQT